MNRSKNWKRKRQTRSRQAGRDLESEVRVDGRKSIPEKREKKGRTPPQRRGTKKNRGKPTGPGHFAKRRKGPP